jgi:hypothetical protein
MIAPQRLPAVIEARPKNPPEETSDSFDWSDTSSVVIPKQLETAAYWNANGDLIRQRNWSNEDHWIVINENQVDVFIEKLTDFCGIPSVGK